MENRQWNRRDWIWASTAGLASVAAWNCGGSTKRQLSCETRMDPIHAIIPIVGDGRWIWREPPAETGQLEPREFEVRIGIEATGRIGCLNFAASTVAPVEHPEQTILESRVETEGCDAALQSLAPGVSQLAMTAASIADEQKVKSEAIFRIRLTKTHWGYSRDRFSDRLEFDKQITREFLGESPGIEVRLPNLKKIVGELSQAGRPHPWDLAQSFHEWVHTKIEGVPMPYTSVKRALETRRGDCEERAGVFIALCRAAGIPARLVWVPNHAWAEFLLWDREGQLQWIPAHTAAYSWFGWTGAHELVLQKGDRIRQIGMDKNVRLVSDWWRYQGTKPRLNFFATVKPLPNEENADPGPGDREKQANGQWLLVGNHRDQRYLRP